MLLRQCPSDTPQHKVIIGVLSRVLYQYVLVQTEVHPQEVIGLGAHHHIATPHSTCVPIPQPRFASWEEMCARVLQPITLMCRLDFLCAHAPFCIGQVCIEVDVQQQLGPSGPPDDVRDGVLYDQGIVGGDQHPTTCHQCQPAPSWKMTTSGPWRHRASKDKCSALQ